MEMRKALCTGLDDIMSKNSKVVVINADLSRPNGISSLEEKYPERSFNVGIAEQSMACIAAGMSSYGFIPFIVTFTPFATRRICDQISVSICYADQNVKIIGTDPGISAELNGGTHMSVEDIGVLRSIPNITIIEPVDTVQLSKVLPKVSDYKGPVYIRMFRKEIETVLNGSEEFNIFGSLKLKEGHDVTIFCSGIMVQESMLAAKSLSKIGIDAEVINIHTIKPIDRTSVIDSAKKTCAVVTAENHNIIGGLRSAICEVLMEEFPVPLRSVGIKDTFGQVGKLPWLKQTYGMNSDHIVNAAVEAVKAKKLR